MTLNYCIDSVLRIQVAGNAYTEATFVDNDIRFGVVQLYTLSSIEVLLSAFPHTINPNENFREHLIGGIPSRHPSDCNIVYLRKMQNVNPNKSLNNQWCRCRDEFNETAGLQSNVHFFCTPLGGIIYQIMKLNMMQMSICLSNHEISGIQWHSGHHKRIKVKHSRKTTWFRIIIFG